MKIKDKKKKAPDSKSETFNGMEYVENFIYKFYYKYLTFSFAEKVFTIIALIYLFFWIISLLKGY